MDYYVHPTATVDVGANISEGVKIWHYCHIRKESSLGKNVNLGKDVYIDIGVSVGKKTHIQNGVSVYHGITISDYCFVGPHVIFTNDLYPRSGNKNWNITPTVMETGASIGAGSVIRCGITLGAFCMIGAGAIVTKSIEPFSLVMGFPAKTVGVVCACGQTQKLCQDRNEIEFYPFCKDCKENLDEEMYEIAQNIYHQKYMLHKQFKNETSFMTSSR